MRDGEDGPHHPTFRTLQEPVYGSTDLETMYERMTAKMLESFSEYLNRGSGWMFRRVLRWDITFSRNRPIKGSSYIPLPVGLKKTRSLINVQNKKDHHCFKWAILRHIHPRECPIKFYFDTESILKPIDETRGNTKLSQRHVMSAFCLYPVSRVEGFSMGPMGPIFQTRRGR